MKNKKQI